MSGDISKEVEIFTTELPDLIADGVNITTYLLDYVINQVTMKIGVIKELNVLNSILDLIPEV